VYSGERRGGQKEDQGTEGTKGKKGRVGKKKGWRMERKKGVEERKKTGQMK
jgi:hypothetical protein